MSLEEQAANLSQAEIISLLISQHELLSQKETHLKALSSKDERIAELEQLSEALKEDLDWFTRQYFGQKSERRILEADARQLNLGEMLDVAETAPPKKQTVKEYERTQRGSSKEPKEDEGKLRFDSSVPVEVIEIPNPELEGLSEDEYEIVTEKVTDRLAQKPERYPGPDQRLDRRLPKPLGIKRRI